MLFRTWFAAMLAAIALIASASGGILITTAIVFQQSIASLAPETNGLIEMARWSMIQDEWRAMQESTTAPRGELIQVEQHLAQLEPEAEAAREELHRQIYAIATRGLASSATEDEGAALQELETTVARDPARWREIRPLVAQARETLTRLQALEPERTTLTARKTELASQISTATAAVFEHLDAYGPGVRDHFVSIDAQIRSLRYTFALGTGTMLADMHPAVLTTMLALQMGILGAMVLALPGFFAGQSSSVMGIVMRVVFGLVGGLFGYLLLNIFLTSTLTSADGVAILRVAPSVVGTVAFLFGAFSFDLALWARDSITRRFGRVRA